MLSIAASAIYSYVFFVSFLLWGALHYYQISLSLINIVSLYGYAMFVFIPVSVICVIPLEPLKWALAMVAFASSGTNPNSLSNKQAEGRKFVWLQSFDSLGLESLWFHCEFLSFLFCFLLFLFFSFRWLYGDVLVACDKSLQPTDVCCAVWCGPRSSLGHHFALQVLVLLIQECPDWLGKQLKRKQLSSSVLSS